MIMFDRRLLSNYGWSLLLMILLFAGVSLINLYSASFQTGLGVFKKQLIWVGIGVVGMIFVSFLNYRMFERYALYIYGISILSLVLVLLLGKQVAGAKSWLQIGAFATVQPSEFAKLAVIIVMARLYDRDYQNDAYGILDLIKPLGFVLLPLVLVMLQPDLGTALVLVLIAASMLVFMGIKRTTLAIVLVCVVSLSFPTWQYFLKDYQKDRIKTFLDPSRDPLDAGYNAIQSQIAVGSGKFAGKGFTKGSQTQLRFIPAQQTDFVFSVFAEEWGFMGGIFVLLLYFIIILWILDAASRAKDKFGMLVCFGVASMFFWHMVINIGMVIGLLPVTGVPLLIMSYGGSSALTAMLGIGLVLAVKARKSPMSANLIELK